MSNEGFREIQLNGKQLVFLFMAGTVVLVVTFLCGVMVGRGVESQPVATAADAAVPAPVDPTAAVLAPSTPVSTTRSGMPITANETLTYTDRLEDPDPPAEALAPPTEPMALADTRRSELPAPDTEQAPTPAGTAGLAEPPGSGFVVQVAAVRARGEAESIATRLGSKGYPAFVTTAGSGATGVYRVRIGKYDDRREAESVAGRLEREEQFKPWITR